MLLERYSPRTEDDWLALLSGVFPETASVQTLSYRSVHTSFESLDCFGTSNDSRKCWLPSQYSSSSRSCGLSSVSVQSTIDADCESTANTKEEARLSDYVPSSSRGASLALQILKSHVPPHFQRVFDACATIEDELRHTLDGANDDDIADWIVVNAQDEIALTNGDQSWCRSSPPMTPCQIAEQVMAQIYKWMRAPMTVSSQFRVHAPEAFQRLAEVRPWRIDSLRGPVEALPTSSRSGAWIFRSNDQRLVLKRISAAEKDTLVALAQDYVDHVARHNDSLLCSLFGCYSFCQNGRSRYFVLMQNCCPPSASVEATYDLKGSTVCRSVRSPAPSLFSPSSSIDALETSLSSPVPNPMFALKDNDLRTPIELDAEATWCSLKAGLERDSEFLRQHGLGDYSLMVVSVKADGDSAPDPVAADGVGGRAPEIEGAPPRTDALRKPSLLQTLMHHFKPPRGGAAQEATPRCADGQRWTPWPCADGTRVYLGIIDFLSPWSSLNIGDSLSIPHGRVLEYAVMKYLQPGASLMPPDAYQGRFARHLAKKFAFPGLASASEDSILSPASSEPQLTSPCWSLMAQGPLLESFCCALSPSSGGFLGQKAPHWGSF